jgi:Ca2+-binding EF-hand superfamily protein
MTERAENMHARFDADGDGKLTAAELAAARGFRGDAAKADADGDGVITVEELQKAMRGGFRRGGITIPRDGSGSASE